MLRIKLSESFDDENFSSNKQSVYDRYSMGHGTASPIQNKKKSSAKPSQTEPLLTDQKIDSKNGFTDSLDYNKLAKLGILRDMYLYEIEVDAPDGEERWKKAIDKYGEDKVDKYLRPNADDKKRAKEMGKIIGARTGSQEHDIATKAKSVQKEKPEMYNAIMNCKSDEELNKVFKKYRKDAMNGNFTNE